MQLGTINIYLAREDEADMIIDGNMIMSGFVSKVVNNLADFEWNKVKNVYNERKSHEQSIETRIYQVTVDAINVFTFDKYKNQDILYIVAESIFRGFKEGKNYIEAVKMGLQMLDSQITNDRCVDFFGVLCDEICKDKNDILYKTINIYQIEQIIGDVDKGFKRSERNQEHIREDIHKCFEMGEQNNREIQKKLDYLVGNADNKEDNLYSKTRVENRAEEYAAKWDKNVFLNDFKKRDINAGVNVKLKDIYLEEQLPHYTWKKDHEPLSDIKDLLRECTVDNNGRNMLLILGQAGIGKSTLITWIMVNFIEKKDSFLVYQFAPDLKNIDWQGDDILDYIFQTLKMKPDELENKVLILDGFDEIHANSDRERILNKLNQELAEMNALKNFSIIITCRENYVYELGRIECDYIILQTWNEIQIKNFCKIYGKKNESTICEPRIDIILENKEIFGIPLILYMVLALNITIEENNPIVYVYDQIFSLDRGGIYERCIRNSRYGAEHKISESRIKWQIHQISQSIAFWIFENNPEEASIPRSKYEEICDIVINKTEEKNEDIKRDFMSGNYFKLIRHCEGMGTEELSFIHRSMYEYFVAVYFVESIQNLTLKEAAGKLGELLKKGKLSWLMLEVADYKFDVLHKCDLPSATREIFQIMLQDGMTCHMNYPCKNILNQEINIFANMLMIVCAWNSELGKLDKNIISYLKHNNKFGLYLCGIDLKGSELFGINLIEANLMEANLMEAKLRGANLIGADLSRANLKGADLMEANLVDANLMEANLEEAELREANLVRADLMEANLKGASLCRVNLSGANLSGANLEGAYLYSANLMGAFLGSSKKFYEGGHENISGANLTGVDLSGAVTDQIRLEGANLKDTIFNKEQADALCKKYDLSDSKVFLGKGKKGNTISYKEYCIKKIRYIIR